MFKFSETSSVLVKYVKTVTEHTVALIRVINKKILSSVSIC